jgi:S1-C subfamily serine protease
MLKRRVVYIPVALLALVLALFSVNWVAAQNDSNTGGQAFLGVSVSSSDQGVRVEEVASGSPAEKAGVKVGDVITTVGGEDVTADTIRDVVAKHAVGDTVTVDITRGTEKLSLDVTLAARPQQPDVNIQVMPGMGMMLGLQVEQTDQGLVVRQVAANSAAEKAGLKVGDIITKVGDTEIKQLADVLTALRNLDLSKPLSVEVKRGSETVTLEVSPQDFAMPFGQGQQFEIPFGNNGQGFSMPFGMMAGGARLGVTFITLDESVAKEHNITQTEGALITEVTKDSPADKAGLKVNDVVTAVDGDKVDAEHTLRDRLLAYESGDKVTLSVARGSETLELKATLDQADFGGMMMPRGFHFFGPDGSRGFMFPPIPGAPGQPGEATPEATAQPNM